MCPLLGFVNAAQGTFRYHGTCDEQLEMTAMKDTEKFVAAIALDLDAIGAVKCKAVEYHSFADIGDSKSIKNNAIRNVLRLNPIFSDLAYFKISTTKWPMFLRRIQRMNLLGSSCIVRDVEWSNIIS
ncbi:hypothetical protein OCU04_007756 [Sclerotinia nivalis]|uniref:Uncharacterized protein n=1 Tax=Sclerotinia nivalis TaxID=352851 RepID=A0A9X0AJG0_9HELO|nr:hypothetical protein OCU04_007756 [Sclerotinia nivalis]